MPGPDRADNHHLDVELQRNSHLFIAIDASEDSLHGAAGCGLWAGCLLDTCVASQRGRRPGCRRTRPMLQVYAVRAINRVPAGSCHFFVFYRSIAVGCELSLRLEMRTYKDGIRHKRVGTSTLAVAETFSAREQKASAVRPKCW